MTATITAVAAKNLPSNQELVQQRLAVARAKKQARNVSVQQAQERNLHLKQLLHDHTTGYPVPQLYAIKISVCDQLREELKLSGREKRGRVFVEQNSPAIMSLKALKMELHAFFRALRKSTFTLAAGYPQVADDGTISSSSFNNETYWTIESDQDVVQTFQAADQFFEEHKDILKRPSIAIHVQKDPNAPPPPPPPAYLTNMPDPAASPTMTMLSFYAFPPGGIENPEEFSVFLRKTWKPFQALGRVYVAKEGVNAQMSVPTTVLNNFIQCCQEIPQLGTNLENGINVDPHPLTREEFAVAGVPAAGGKPMPPFTNLHVRVRHQVVADGLDKELDWQSAGYDMPPLEWHAKLKQAKEEEGGADPKPIVLDCRNTYETDVGRFEGAEPLGTESFRESWDVLKDRLKDLPKDTPIYGYCTGGIRCVKVGAYVTQELGFSNFTRLAGGIIAYDRTLKEKAPEEEPLFKGTNFVFDNRLGRAITEDSLGTCITCGAETSLVSNCRNDNCHKRMIQCEKCSSAFMGTCSDACRHRLVNGLMTPQRNRNGASSEETQQIEQKIFKSLDEYSTGHSSPVPSIYPEMEFNTRALIPSGSHMVSGSTQGRLLKQLASMTREGRILELGTFTGYATACLLEGAETVGQVTGMSGGSRQGGPYVMSMERDAKAFDVAVAQLSCMVEHGTGEAGAEELCALRSGSDSVPSIHDHIVSLDYHGIAGCELIHVSDALATIESMAAGTSDLQPAPFDMVFVDADKTRLIDYLEACLSSDRVLKKGGLIVVDNVLWKGLVLEASSGEFSSLSEDEATEESEQLRKNRRARKLANKMHRFNSEIVKDDRVEVLVLPVRDGLSVIRKK